MGSALALPSARREALERACRGLALDASVRLEAVARESNGYAAADLVALVREATLCATRRLASEGATARAPATAVDAASALLLQPVDFEKALRRVRGSVLRPVSSVMAPVEPLGWDQIGGADEIKLRVRRAIEWPLTRAAAYSRLGVHAPKGVLLHGPPGCAKTSLARAAAGASGVAFST